ncbi:hypothetical protein E0L36_02540 [Streptomyces sp. AJS327]|uniref:hypothetical protein n=1 Tax=Streptomyces sp. AJS327 TaxID=2545265 RepID=UPI0015DE3BE5|nr:hypothetical protein [Streptomyces sp. AJS327]MBA0049815.1 hypothetical protein [Streptomyces sp. AJS327]
MTSEIPLSPRPLSHLSHAGRRVMTTRELRAHGVSTAETAERCRPGGGWQMLLPGVCLLHPARPTGEDLLYATLLYAGRVPYPREPERAIPPSAPRVPARERPAPGPVITGMAALVLHGLPSSPPLAALDHIDVLVAAERGLPSAGCARVVRTQEPPAAAHIAGVPVAPVARAVADAVARLTDPAATQRLLVESVRGGHCAAQALVGELTRARVLDRPHVVAAIEALLAEGRALAEDQLYEVVLGYGLPEPWWNVTLQLPGGPALGHADAYWPEYAVAVRIDARESAYPGRRPPAGCGREALERLGVTMVLATPEQLRESPAREAAIIRTALMTAGDREPAAYLTVRPR